MQSLESALSRTRYGPKTKKKVEEEEDKKEVKKVKKVKKEKEEEEEERGVEHHRYNYRGADSLTSLDLERETE